MKVRKIATRLVEQLTDAHIYRSLPRGIDLVQDIGNFLPLYRPRVIFDIGANKGQSSRFFLAQFPDSYIHCFEPVSDTFTHLQRNMKDNARIDCHQLAFGSSKGTGKMVLEGPSSMFFLSDQSELSSRNEDAPTEFVNTTTIDEFCRMKEIDRIDYLKIDTEGGDLDILKGAVGMLTRQSIDLVQVEAGMNPANDRHISLESLKAFLESHNYFLFGIYEQVREWPTREPHLRRANPVFISRQMIEKYRMPREPAA